MSEYRCYLKCEGEHWIGICIDLSLAVQVDTKSEVYYKLNLIVREYVKEAKTVHSQYEKQLLSRKAPLSLRLEYFLNRICPVESFDSWIVNC